MLMKLNEEAVAQLQTIMLMTGRTNYKHTVQSMISQVLNNLRKADAKKKATNI
ncbi:hypothetical protein D3C72_2181960 [compost metagenome]